MTGPKDDEDLDATLGWNDEYQQQCDDAEAFTNVEDCSEPDYDDGEYYEA